MKLELKHLAPYLPYSVRYKAIWISSFKNQPDTVENRIMNTENIGTLYKKRYKLKSAKPILRPLSDLTKEIEVNGEKFVPEDILFIEYGAGYANKTAFINDFMPNIIYTHYSQISYRIMQFLFEWHFDVFGLIENNLAIDINTLNK